MEGMEIENIREAQKSRAYIRCAKAALLLSRLKLSRNRLLDSTDFCEQVEREMALRSEVEDPRRKLVRERLKNRTMKLCSVTELSLQMALLLFLWTICFMFALKFICLF